MDLNEELRACFGDYESDERSQAWQDIKSSLQVGSLVSGRVVARRAFGVFVDIGLGFPALILVVKLNDAEKAPYTSMEMYPAIGDTVEGRVCAFADHNRQIGLSQLEDEPMFNSPS
ncbi:MAG: hypothetical protein AB7I37_12005 [Pirellulales bacterium]